MNSYVVMNEAGTTVNVFGERGCCIGVLLLEGGDPKWYFKPQVSYLCSYVELEDIARVWKKLSIHGTADEIEGYGE